MVVQNVESSMPTVLLVRKFELPIGQHQIVLTTALLIRAICFLAPFCEDRRLD